MSALRLLASVSRPLANAHAQMTCMLASSSCCAQRYSSCGSRGTQPGAAATTATEEFTEKLERKAGEELHRLEEQQTRVGGSNEEDDWVDVRSLSMPRAAHQAALVPVQPKDCPFNHAQFRQSRF